MREKPTEVFERRNLVPTTVVLFVKVLLPRGRVSIKCLVIFVVKGELQKKINKRQENDGDCFRC